MTPVHDPRFSAAAKREAVAEDVTREEYMKPLILMAIGGGILLVTFLFIGGPAGAAFGIGAIAMVLAIQVVVGFLALLIVSAVASTSVGTLPLALLRLAGAFTLIAGTAIILVPLGCFGPLLNLLVLGGVLMWLFDFEGAEAVGVIVLMIILSWGARYLVGALFA